jgi:hypothetical protein
MENLGILYCHFGILELLQYFKGHLEHFAVFWYIFSSFGI